MGVEEFRVARRPRVFISTIKEFVSVYCSLTTEIQSLYRSDWCVNIEHHCLSFCIKENNVGVKLDLTCVVDLPKFCRRQHDWQHGFLYQDSGHFKSESVLVRFDVLVSLFTMMPVGGTIGYKHCLTAIKWAVIFTSKRWRTSFNYYMEKFEQNALPRTTTENVGWAILLGNIWILSNSEFSLPWKWEKTENSPFFQYFNCQKLGHH